MGKTVPLQIKKLVLKMFRLGHRSKKIAKTLGLDRSTVKEWQYLFDGGDTRSETDKRTRRRSQVLEDLLQSAGRERDRSSKKKIVQAIERGKASGLSVSFMLKIIGVSRSDYYYWLRHLDRNELELVERIRLLQIENNWNVGSKTMAQLLRRDKDNPVVVNHKKVARIMSENNLHAKQKLRKHPKDYYRQKKYQAANLPTNILNRDFLSDIPGTKLLTDITYIHVQAGWCFLSAVKDLFNGEILAYSISQRLNLELVLDTFEKLKSRLGSLDGVLLHSDRGWTYTNPRLMRQLKTEGVVQSLSAKGNCWDNAPMESFFSTLKSETIHHDGYYYRNVSYAEMVLLVQNYIEHYNDKRIVKKLGWLSPVQYRLSKCSFGETVQKIGVNSPYEHRKATPPPPPSLLDSFDTIQSCPVFYFLFHNKLTQFYALGMQGPLVFLCTDKKLS